MSSPKRVNSRVNEWNTDGADQGGFFKRLRHFQIFFASQKTQISVFVKQKNPENLKVTKSLKKSVLIRSIRVLFINMGINSLILWDTSYLFREFQPSLVCVLQSGREPHDSGYAFVVKNSKVRIAEVLGKLSIINFPLSTIHYQLFIVFYFAITNFPPLI